MGAALGLIGPLASIGSSLLGRGNTASNVPQAPSVYQPTGQPQADQNLQGGIGAQWGTAQNLAYNPGISSAVYGANTAGQLGQQAGLSQFQQGQSLVPYATQALNAGFDPMGNVYNQQFQQNTDQTRAGLEARGIDSTPYGAGVEAQSNLNFNNAWEQNALARMGQGASTATGLMTTGANLATGGANEYLQGSLMPYNINQTIGQNQLQAEQIPIQNWLSYLGVGQGASSIGTQQQQTNLNQNQLGWNQNMQLGQNLGQGLQGLAKGWQGYANSGTGNFNTFNAPGYSFPQAA